jgi:8-oxo-dGTP diphosphatase
VVTVCKPYAARVLLNGDEPMARRVGADGIHLSAARLKALQHRPQKLICAASCHNAAELAQAASLGLDFVLLSTVLPTLSHPDAVPLGWAGFSSVVGEYPLPVYALGGLRPNDLRAAWSHGAHGIAMQRAVWGG